MSGITVYGASDDLIEIEGEISEEFSALSYEDGDGAVLGFSDGTVLRIRYSDEGVWRIVLVIQGHAAVRIEQAPENDEGNYSDRAVLDGPVFRWVVVGNQIAMRKGQE